MLPVYYRCHCGQQLDSITGGFNAARCFFYAAIRANVLVNDLLLLELKLGELSAFTPAFHPSG